MNDKEFDSWLEAARERWRPFHEWKGKIEERIQRLDVRTKLALARSAYHKAQAEMRAWQRAAAGGSGEVAVRAAPDVPDDSGKGGRRAQARAQQPRIDGPRTEGPRQCGGRAGRRAVARWAARFD